MIRCKVTVWEPGVPRKVEHEYQAPKGCEVDHGKAVLFQHEVGSGAEVEYQVETLVNGQWDTVRPRANRALTAHEFQQR